VSVHTCRLVALMAVQRVACSQSGSGGDTGSGLSGFYPAHSCCCVVCSAMPANCARQDVGEDPGPAPAAPQGLAAAPQQQQQQLQRVGCLVPRLLIVLVVTHCVTADFATNACSCGWCSLTFFDLGSFYLKDTGSGRRVITLHALSISGMLVVRLLC
jgi:hypothetical protein